MPRSHVWIGVLLLSFFAVLLLLAYLYYVFSKRETYTRERFAFAALTVASASFVALIAQIAGKQTVWEALARLVAYLRGLPQPPSDPPHIADHIVMAGIWFGLLWLINKIYLGWDGALSERQFTARKYHRQASMVGEGLVEAKRILGRQPAPTIHPLTPRNDGDLNLLAIRQPLAWHLQARDLLCLRNPSFDIKEDDWHPKRNCWIGIDRQSKTVISAYCHPELPDPEEIDAFIDYSTKQAMRQYPANTLEDIFVPTEDNAPSMPSAPIPRTPKLHYLSDNDLLNDLVDFSNYFEDIRRRVENIALPDSDLRLIETYTPTHSAGDDQSMKGNTDDYLDAWLDEESQRHLALLGEYGQGKSTTALMMAYRLLAKGKPVVRIPIVLELRGKSPKNMTPEELLAAWAYPYSINPKAVMKLHERGKILLILEGFDEIAQVSDVESRLGHFRTLWEFASSHAKILITGRPNFFLDDDEMKQALGIATSTATGPYCEAIRLVPFTLDQIRDALRWCKPWIREAILELARKDVKFLEIVSRGSLLYVVSQLWEKRLSKYEGTLDSAAIIDLFLDSCFRRQSEKRKGAPDFMILNESERRFFTTGIATWMGANYLPNQIDRRSLRLSLNALYEHLPESVSSTSNGIASPPSRPLKQRLAGEEDPISAIENDIRSSSVLVIDQTKQGALRFAHKSFMELLLAKTYAAYLEASDERSACLVAATNIKLRVVLASREVTAFFAEILTRDTPKQDQRAVAQQLYRVILRSPANSVPLPTLGVHFILVCTLYLRAQIAKDTRWPLYRLFSLSSTLATCGLLCLTGIVLSKSLYPDFHGLKVFDLPLLTFTLLMMCLLVGVRSMIRGEIQTTIELWLRCCEALKIEPDNVCIPGQPRSNRLSSLISEDRKLPRIEGLTTFDVLQSAIVHRELMRLHKERASQSPDLMVTLSKVDIQKKSQ